MVRLTAGASPSTLTFKDGTTVSIPANGTTTLAWGQPGNPADINATLRANGNIVLHGPAVASTTGGSLNYAGTITGSGTVQFSNTSLTATPTLTLGGSASVLVPPGGQTTAILAGGAWTQDATALIAAGKPVMLSLPTVATLPAGVTELPVGFWGNGTLTLTASQGGGSLRLPGGAVIVVPETGETLTATLNGNTVTAIDGTAAVRAGHDIALGAVPITITLPSGTPPIRAPSWAPARSSSSPPPAARAAA